MPRKKCNKNKMAKIKGTAKQKKIKIELTFLGLFLWSLFFLFLLAWVFVLGIFAERGVLSGALPEIENPFNRTRSTDNTNEELKDQKPDEDPAFNFYNTLENKKNEIKRKSIPRMEKGPSQAITLSRDETDEPSVRSMSDEKEERKQAKPLSEVGQGFFSVQIASVTATEGAQRLVKELVDKDYDAYYYSTTVNGKITYRIMCGRFSKRSEAVWCLNKLKRDTGYKGFIVKIGK